MTENQKYSKGLWKLLSVVFVSMLLLLTLTPALTILAKGQAGSSYIVKSGDCLYSIARNALGDESRWREIYELNKDSISDPGMILPGQKIMLPGSKSGQADSSVRSDDTKQADSSVRSDDTRQTDSSGQSDDAHVKKIAKKYLTQAKKEEPAITAILQKMESDASYLQGLDNRFKSEESLIRKIKTDAADDGITVVEAAANIADILRYTLCTRDDEYAETVNATLKALTDAGCTVVKFKNTWGGSAYKGINTQLKTPSGYVFELQFHTPDSFKAKEEEHKYYEIRRDPSTSDKERERLEKLSAEIYGQVPIPKGATELSWDTVTK